MTYTTGASTMRMTVALLATLALSTTTAAAELVAMPKPISTKAVAPKRTIPQTKTAQQQRPFPTPQERRCAYLGRWGSFHILGKDGTAAYRFASGAMHFAELRVGRPNPNWWIYNQVPSDTADNNITAWAFARQPYCGEWQVLMFRNGAWQHYENTFAWGKGIGEDATGAAGSSDPIFDLQRDVRGLKEDVRNLKAKVGI